MIIHRYKDVTGYYVAEFDTWGKNVRSGLTYQVRDWCKQTYGPTNRNDPNPRWKDDIIWGQISFRDESDLAAFILRWE